MKITEVFFLLFSYFLKFGFYVSLFLSLTVKVFLRLLVSVVVFYLCICFYIQAGKKKKKLLGSSIYVDSASWQETLLQSHSSGSEMWWGCEETLYLSSYAGEILNKLFSLGLLNFFREIPSCRVNRSLLLSLFHLEVGKVYLCWIVK